jgi:beta-galactosidase
MRKNIQEHTIGFRNGHFILDGEPFFLYSGEVHYFRIPRDQWKSRLRALKAARLNTVSTYIPWNWHEPEEGQTDFTGRTHPQRDVFGFVDLAREEGLSCLARVGPVSNAELVNEGVPTWLLKRHPDVFVKGHRDVGNLPHVTMVSYLHPTFQEKVTRWYDGLLPRVAERQVTRGGNIIGVQLCNEVAMVHWLQKGADRREKVTRFYQRFLEERYRTVDGLNRAYGTSYANFSDVPQPDADNVGPHHLALYVDWALFYRRYYATYFWTLSSRAKSHGIDVPLLCNIPQFYDYDIRGRGTYAPMTTSMFRDFPLLTPGLVFGGAYQMRHLDFENFHDVALTTEVTRLLNQVDPQEPRPAGPGLSDRLPALPSFQVRTEADVPVVCAELQTGIMRDRPRLYPQQVRLNIKSSVGQGLAGLNAYMFAGGINPQGMGAFGAYHDWQAPVGPRGEKRPHLAPLEEFGRFLRWAGPLLAQTRKAVDTTFGFYLPYYANEYWSGPWVDALEARRTNLWYDGLARLVQLAGFSYDFVDLQRTPLDVLQKRKSLWVFSLEMMDGDTQAKLAEYVHNGGRLVLYPRLPTSDLMGAADTTLADRLGLRLSSALPGNIYSQKSSDYWVQGPIQTFQTGAGQEPLVPLSKDAAAAVNLRAGRGQALVIGFGMPHVFDHYRDWVKTWAESLGVAAQVRCEPWDVQASLRENGDFGFLFVFNYHFTARNAAVTLRLPGTRETVTLPRRGRAMLEPLSGAVWPLRIPLSPEVRLAYATAEIWDVRVTSKAVDMVICTPPGHAVEIALDLKRRPAGVRAGPGIRPSLAWTKGRAHVSLKALKATTRLRVSL